MLAAMQTKQIIGVNGHGENKKLHFHEENLRDLLSESDPNSPIVMLCVAGAYRTGKSFLLNSMVRYLTAPDKSRWLDHKAESFEWKSGSEPHTTGMVMSQPIPITLPSSQEKALLILMDSQGLFDANSQFTDSTKVFVVSTLVSSLQVFNLMRDLTGSDLEHLQLFAEIGRCAMKSTDEKPFQDLLFLIRDWAHRDDYPLGSQGGKDLVERRLASNDEGLAKQRKEFRRCFTSVDGFLLPYPGEAVAEGYSFKGDAKDMKPDFVKKLGELMSELFTPGKMSVKKMGSCPLTCAQLVEAMKAYVNCVNSDKFVKVGSIVEVVSEVQNMAAVHAEFKSYVGKVDEMLKKERNLLDPKSLKTEHEAAKAEVLESFKQRRTIRNTSKSDQRYYSLLEGKIEAEFSRTKKLIRQAQGAFEQAAHATKQVVDECIAVYRKHIDSGEYSRRNQSWFPAWFMPMLSNEAKLAAHEAARNKALSTYEKQTENIPEFIKEPYKEVLEKAIEGLLYKSMGRNVGLQMFWIGFGVGLLVGAGAVLLLSPNSLDLVKQGVEAAVTISLGAATIWYTWAPIMGFLKKEGFSVYRTSARVFHGTGKVSDELVSLADPQQMAKGLKRIMGQYKSKPCIVSGRTPMPC